MAMPHYLGYGGRRVGVKDRFGYRGGTSSQEVLKESKIIHQRTIQALDENLPYLKTCALLNFMFSWEK